MQIDQIAVNLRITIGYKEETICNLGESLHIRVLVLLAECQVVCANYQGGFLLYYVPIHEGGGGSNSDYTAILIIRSRPGHVNTANQT